MFFYNYGINISKILPSKQMNLEGKKWSCFQNHFEKG